MRQCVCSSSVVVCWAAHERDGGKAREAVIQKQGGQDCGGAWYGMACVF